MYTGDIKGLTFSLSWPMRDLFRLYEGEFGIMLKCHVRV